MDEILQSFVLITPCSFGRLRGSLLPWSGGKQLPWNFRNEVSGILLRLKLILINEQKKNYLFITMRTMVTDMWTTRILILDDPPYWSYWRVCRPLRGFHLSAVTRIARYLLTDCVWWWCKRWVVCLMNAALIRQSITSSTAFLVHSMSFSRLSEIRIVSKRQGKPSFCPNKIGVLFYICKFSRCHRWSVAMKD